MKQYEHKHEKSSKATGRPRIIEVKRESPSDILLGDDRYSEERLCVSANVTWRKCCRPESCNCTVYAKCTASGCKENEARPPRLERAGASTSGVTHRPPLRNQRPVAPSQDKHCHRRSHGHE